jgi:hypothetical protein
VLVGEQFDAVVERADGRKQIVAKARTEKARKFVGFHLNGRPCPWCVNVTPYWPVRFKDSSAARLPGDANSC